MSLHAQKPSTHVRCRGDADRVQPFRYKDHSVVFDTVSVIRRVGNCQVVGRHLNDEILRPLGRDWTPFLAGRDQARTTSAVKAGWHNSIAVMEGFIVCQSRSGVEVLQHTLNFEPNRRPLQYERSGQARNSARGVGQETV